MYEKELVKELVRGFNELSEKVIEKLDSNEGVCDSNEKVCECISEHERWTPLIGSHFEVIFCSRCLTEEESSEIGVSVKDIKVSLHSEGAGVKAVACIDSLMFLDSNLERIMSKIGKGFTLKIRLNGASGTRYRDIDIRDCDFVERCIDLNYSARGKEMVFRSIVKGTYMTDDERRASMVEETRVQKGCRCSGEKESENKENVL